MTTPQARAKEWGREVENLVLRALRNVFPALRRVGSPGYTKAHADLVQDGIPGTLAKPIRIVAVKDKRRTALVALSIEDFLRLVPPGIPAPVVVQCKGRSRSWIGSVYQDLKDAT